MKRKWPAVEMSELKSILTRHCGEPIRVRGSHHYFKSPYTGKRVLLAMNSKDMWGAYVRSLLVSDLGLTEEAAWQEVSR